MSKRDQPASLYEAAECDDVVRMRALLAGGADLHEREGNVSPLSNAVTRGHAECVEVLLEAGANPLDQVLENPLFNRALGRGAQCAGDYMSEQRKRGEPVDAAAVDATASAGLATGTPTR